MLQLVNFIVVHSIRAINEQFIREGCASCCHESNPATGLLTLLQVNATGVMPVIFSSSLLALPTALARYANSRPVEAFAAAFNPSGPFYLPVSLCGFLPLLMFSPCLFCCPCCVHMNYTACLVHTCLVAASTRCANTKPVPVCYV